ncbi:uncharacterized protein LOC112493890 [Cephus cinctus]|uniref:Uncharacterized protein LOC112493890 n=1 Tax=Cephus cinctus TaxID=211228 RepID=A0AAJ7RBI7_CEPCN|nr:uncharacterized protein LOC112493890 [Cephus cinctus]
MMEMFGLTLTGYSNFIKEVIKEDYKEPRILPNNKEILDIRLRKNPLKTFSEVYNEIDPILGTGDGFSYGSHERLRLQRKKGLTKPVGPTDIYRIPVSRSQEIGFWIKDPLLEESTWMKLPKSYGSRRSDVSE